MTPHPSTRADALEAVLAEVNAEKAASLGRAAAGVEKALAALAAGEGGSDAEVLLRNARDAVWGFFVQRDVVGLRDHAEVIAHYGIPPSVLNALGSR